MISMRYCIEGTLQQPEALSTSFRTQVNPAIKVSNSLLWLTSCDSPLSSVIYSCPCIVFLHVVAFVGSTCQRIALPFNSGPPVSRSMVNSYRIRATTTTSVTTATATSTTVLPASISTQHEGKSLGATAIMTTSQATRASH